MNTKLRRLTAVALILAFLLSFAEIEAISAQSAFNRLNHGAKTVKQIADNSQPDEKATKDDSGSSAPGSLPAYGSENLDREIAAAFAPVFYQGLGTHPRYDYITNFDFDGDWRGDNNWANAADTRFPLRAYVYYSVAETETHYFVAYAVFHPRDYKGGKVRGRILSRAIEIGVGALGRFDPTGRAAEATLAHENDLEGALVVAEKRGNRPQDARVRFVETLAHNRFLKYEPRPDTTRDGIGRVRLSDGRRAELFIEPRGHGIHAHKSEKSNNRTKDLLVYKYTGQASDSAKRGAGVGSVGYALTPLYTTLWAQALAGENQTYAEAHDYRKLFAAVATKNANGMANANQTIENKIGSAFRGKVGGTNMARPPWGWFDAKERDRPLGEWFFDPAGTVKRHFKLGESFTTVYTHAPAAGVTRRL
jgi:hypothetical protein